MQFFYDSKIDMNIQFENIQNELNFQIKTQNDNLKLLLECLKTLNSIIQNTENIENPKQVSNLLKEVKTNLDNSRNNIANLEKLKIHLNDISNSISNISKTDTNESNTELLNKISSYNELATAYKSIIYTKYNSYNTFIYKYIKNTTLNVNSPSPNQLQLLNTNINESPVFEKKIELKNEQKPVINSESRNNPKEDLSTSNIHNKKEDSLASENLIQEKTVNSEKKQNDEKDTSIPENIATEKIKDNNVLIVSEVQNKVLLPYTLVDLNKILEKDNKYNDLQEIIDTKYTVPLDRYKNSTISRFKESYNLMRKKEKASISNSLNLALELAFNNLLNPAVITACKNLDELDIYLDCLNSNELDKFTFFEVKYEILPTKKA